MILITSRCAQRPVVLHFPCINKFAIVLSVPTTGRLSYRYSTLSMPMTHNVEPYDSQPTISLSSDDSISPFTCCNTLCADVCTGLDLYKYTSGRWLLRDNLERDSRNLNFDFDALRRRIIALCPGATSIIKYEKKEGGYNRAFIFTCDNARRIVARLPFSVAGPARLTTNSEVATITYSKLGTSS